VVEQGRPLLVDEDVDVLDVVDVVDVSPELGVEMLGVETLDVETLDVSPTTETTTATFGTPRIQAAPFASAASTAVIGTASPAAALRPGKIISVQREEAGAAGAAGADQTYTVQFHNGEVKSGLLRQQILAGAVALPTEQAQIHVLRAELKTMADDVRRGALEQKRQLEEAKETMRQQREGDQQELLLQMAEQREAMLLQMKVIRKETREYAERLAFNQRENDDDDDGDNERRRDDDERRRDGVTFNVLASPVASPEFEVEDQALGGDACVAPQAPPAPPVPSAERRGGGGVTLLAEVHAPPATVGAGTVGAGTVGASSANSRAEGGGGEGGGGGEEGVEGEEGVGGEEGAGGEEGVGGEERMGDVDAASISEGGVPPGVPGGSEDLAHRVPLGESELLTRQQIEMLVKQQIELALQQQVELALQQQVIPTQSQRGRQEWGERVQACQDADVDSSLNTRLVVEERIQPEGAGAELQPLAAGAESTAEGSLLKGCGFEEEESLRDLIAEGMRLLIAENEEAMKNIDDALAEGMRLRRVQMEERCRKRRAAKGAILAGAGPEEKAEILAALDAEVEKDEKDLEAGLEGLDAQHRHDVIAQNAEAMKRIDEALAEKKRARLARMGERQRRRRAAKATKLAGAVPEEKAAILAALDAEEEREEQQLVAELEVDKSNVKALKRSMARELQDSLNIPALVAEKASLAELEKLKQKVAEVEAQGKQNLSDSSLGRANLEDQVNAIIFAIKRIQADQKEKQSAVFDELKGLVSRRSKCTITDFCPELSALGSES
jgi:hypothetical protein